MNLNENNNYFPLQWSSHSRLRWWTTLMLHILSYALVVVTAPISFLFVLRSIPEYERAVVLGSTLDMVRIVNVFCSMLFAVA